MCCCCGAPLNAAAPPYSMRCICPSPGGHVQDDPDGKRRTRRWSWRGRCGQRDGWPFASRVVPRADTKPGQGRCVCGDLDQERRRAPYAAIGRPAPAHPSIHTLPRSHPGGQHRHTPLHSPYHILCPRAILGALPWCLRSLQGTTARRSAWREPARSLPYRGRCRRARGLGRARAF